MAEKIPHRASDRSFYGRRKGPALTQRRAALLKTALPSVAVRADEDISNPAALFAHEPEQIWLEIGFGKGEHLAWTAARNAHVGVIGCEPFLNGVAGLLTLMEAQKLQNIRIYPDDARDLLECLPDGSVDRVFLLHPDPWPKARHAKRRFINPPQLNLLARVMAMGADLRISTDHPVYAQWVMVQMAQRSDFRFTAAQATDWRQSPEDWTETRYAAKAKAEGRPPVYLNFMRV